MDGDNVTQRSRKRARDKIDWQAKASKGEQRQVRVPLVATVGRLTNRNALGEESRRTCPTGYYRALAFETSRASSKFARERPKRVLVRSGFPPISDFTTIGGQRRRNTSTRRRRYRCGPPIGGPKAREGRSVCPWEFPWTFPSRIWSTRGSQPIRSPFLFNTL